MEKSRLELLKIFQNGIEKNSSFFLILMEILSFATQPFPILSFSKTSQRMVTKKMVGIINKEELSQKDVDTYNEVINLINTKTNELTNRI